MSDIKLWEYLVSGGVGGMCLVLVGHPLDTVKVRLQTMPKPAPGHDPMYKGTIDCFRKIIAREGPFGLYKGMSAPLVSISPINAVSFFGFGLGRQIFEKFQLPHYYQMFCAGGFSGLATLLIMAPAERVKTLLQIQVEGGGKLYKGPIDVILKLIKEKGISSIYRGLFATLIRDVPSGGMYFFTYELLNDTLRKKFPETTNLGLTIFSGGCAGIAYWIFGMPADVVKSRLQAAPEGRYPNGLRQVFFELIKNEGPLGLYTGLTPVILRAFPANAACFLGFESCKRFLKYIQSNNTGS